MSNNGSLVRHPAIHSGTQGALIGNLKTVDVIILLQSSESIHTLCETKL